MEIRKMIKTDMMSIVNPNPEPSSQRAARRQPAVGGKAAASTTNREATVT
jgi:hypothetical protein